MSWKKAWRQVVPKEHGSWFFVLEPLLLCIPLRTSREGLLLALAAVLAFLVRRPLAAGWGVGAGEAGQVAFARRLACLLLGLAGCVSVPVLIGLPAASFIVLGGMLLLALVSAVYELLGVRRSLPGELAGVLVFGLLPALLLTVSGAGVGLAWRGTLVLLLRSLPSFLSLRAYLRLRKQGDVALKTVLAAPVLALPFAFATWSLGWVPMASVVFSMLFLVRSLVLVKWGRKVAATKLGIMEAVLGVSHSLCLAWALS
jgi:hypothetical protein